MSVTTILFITALCVLVLAGFVAAAVDLWKIGANSLARRRALRHWDWPAFEQELARYTGAGHGPATRRPR